MKIYLVVMWAAVVFKVPAPVPLFSGGPYRIDQAVTKGQPVRITPPV